ncbi:MAG: AAA family ATPase, partial [Succinivibrio sp.]|nr:AAA family ATPase [Succinivibrio sp.]
MSANQTDLFAAIEQEQKDKDSLASSEQLDAFAPLASRLRPQSVDEYIGQSHLIAKGRPLRALLDKGQCYSMVLWGPPGVGKTTLALLFAKSCNAYFEQIPAVTSGIKDIREAVDRALLRKQRGVKTLLFVDEVHRFNKTQQDAFLPHIENGTITFIGA